MFCKRKKFTAVLMTLLESGISSFSKNHEEDQWISDLIQTAICLLSLKPSAFSLFFIFLTAYTSFYYFFKKKITKYCQLTQRAHFSCWILNWSLLHDYTQRCSQKSDFLWIVFCFKNTSLVVVQCSFSVNSVVLSLFI